MFYSALLGNPVSHSISPRLFYELAKLFKIEYSHLKITVPDKRDLKVYINSLINLHFCGFNITCPYKLDMYNLLKDEELSLEAKNIKSINSVVIRNNKMIGYNTDGNAAILSIKKFYPLNFNDHIVIIGAGGVAYSILYEISKLTSNIVVFNEYYDKAEKMVNDLNLDVSYYDLSNKDIFIEKLKEATVIINATSVGMSPNSDESLINEDIFKKISDKKKCFFDVIFNPWETKLLSLANKYNHITISGGYMLIFQAYLVLQLWLDRKFELTDSDISYLVDCMLEELSHE